MTSKPPKRDVQWADVYTPFFFLLRADWRSIGSQRACMPLGNNRSLLQCFPAAGWFVWPSSLYFYTSNYPDHLSRRIRGSCSFLHNVWLCLLNKTSQTYACWQCRGRESSSSQQCFSKVVPARWPSRSLYRNQLVLRYLWFVPYSSLCSRVQIWDTRSSALIRKFYRAIPFHRRDPLLSLSW